MMRINCCSGKYLFTFKKDLQTKYAVYDQTIKQFAKVGNNISTDLLKKFVLSANPKISRQQNYMPKIAHILKSMVPHFQNHVDFYAKQGLFSSILVLYTTMNIHRKIIFELIEKKTNKFNYNSLSYWYQIYNSIVDLHHQSNSKFKSKLKKFLFSQLTSEQFSQKYSPKIDHFQMAIKILKLMIMDRQNDREQCQLLLNYIEQKIIPKMESISLIDRNIGQNIAFLNELIKLQSFEVNSEKFKRILEEAKKFQISQKMQSQKSFVKRQNYIISLTDQNFIKSVGSSVQQNKRIINHGQSSVFETIFARILQQKGYDYEKNVFIGIFEYDVIIKGKKQKIYRPFENIHQKQFKQISSQQWQIFKSMKDFNKIKVNEKLQSPVVLNLNGPYHYIDSDVYGEQRVTRTDEMKGKFLKNYGFQNYNLVHHAKWEQVHEKGIQIQNYIQQLISQNLLKNI